MADSVLRSPSERDAWATAQEQQLLLGGASFSEWATLMSYEAHTCFVAGADIATIVLCASCVEAYLRTEQDDHSTKLFNLIDQFDFSQDLKAEVHALRIERNKWVHLSKTKVMTELPSFEMAYTSVLEASAMAAYRTMLKVLFSNPLV